MDIDVAIVGAGLVGASLAVALNNSGLSVALIDPASPSENPEQQKERAAFDSRVFAIRPASRQFLAACNIWQYVDETRVAPVYKMVVTGDDGISRLSFDAYRSGLPDLALIAENGNLQSAVQFALDKCSSVHQLRGRTCVGANWSSDTVTILLDDGQVISPQLVVAADGANSRLRKFAGIQVRNFAYDQFGVVANFATGRPHHGTAYQWFRADGVLALLPLPGDRVSMVWSSPAAHAREIATLAPNHLAERVTVACECELGDLIAENVAASFPLSLMRVASVVGPRLALIGDAAHNVHPLAGQGLNLGLADSEALASAILQRGPEQAGSRSVLAKYRRTRSEETASMQLATDGLQRLFQASLPGMAWLRNAGLRLTDHLVPIKRLLVKRATG